MIAGHVFSTNGRCSCNRTFGDISGATEANIGHYHWAHSGTLTANELAEIRAEVRRIWDLLVGTATGSGPAAPAQDDLAAAEAA